MCFDNDLVGLWRYLLKRDTYPNAKLQKILENRDIDHCKINEYIFCVLPDEVEDEWVIAPSILDQFSPKTDIQYKGKRKMRIKLSELISTIDQYNGVGVYIDKYEVGDQVIVDSETQGGQTTATVSESRTQQLIQYILREDNQNPKLEPQNGYKPECYVKSFDTFLKEQKGTTSNVQSYMGELDDEDDDWEEE